MPSPSMASAPFCIYGEPTAYNKAWAASRGNTALGLRAKIWSWRSGENVGYA